VLCLLREAFPGLLLKVSNFVMNRENAGMKKPEKSDDIVADIERPNEQESIAKSSAILSNGTKPTSNHNHPSRVIRYEEHQQPTPFGSIAIVRRKTENRIDANQTALRPPSPTKSDISTTFSEFAREELPTSTPLPSDIDTDLEDYEADISSEGELNKVIYELHQSSLPSVHTLGSSEKLKDVVSVESSSESDGSYSEQLYHCLEDMDVAGFDYQELKESDRGSDLSLIISERSFSEPEEDQSSEHENQEASYQIFNKMHGDTEESIDIANLRDDQETKIPEPIEADPDGSEDDESDLSFSKVKGKDSTRESPSKIEATTDVLMNSLYSVNDEAFLWRFPPVIRDASVQLESQVIPLDEPFTFHLSDVYSPVRFWFHCESFVMEVMNLMQADYERLRPSDLRINEENMIPGMLIACFYRESRQWHRAQIILPPSANKKNKGYARVIFVDYGTVGNSDTRDIKVS
jgi:hypothetical protein